MFKKIRILLLTFLACIFLYANGQDSPDISPRYYLHSLADTTKNPSYVPYIEHWINFLYAENDSLRRAYWNPEDIKRWGNQYALFYDGLFQFPQKQLLTYFRPYILSVYCEENFCRIATAFWIFNTEPSETAANNSNPFSIVEVGIYKNNGRYYLTNLFDRRSSNWERITSGKINYLVQPAIKPDHNQMKKAGHFVDSLAGVFSTSCDSITYIVCRSPNELGYLLGFNFFYAGFTYGKTFHDARTIMSGIRSFNYPHELSHLVIDPVIKGGHFFGEGLTTFFGGSQNKTYEEMVDEFKDKYPVVNDSLFKVITAHRGSPYSYTLAAIITEYIYDKRGIEGLKALSGAPSGAHEFLGFLQEKTGISKQEVFEAINRKIRG
ncbi:MAG: hypothetical protein ACOC22_03580 [bacterium]